jgi:hypothetical protein
MTRLLAAEPPVAEGTLVTVVAEVRIAGGHCTERRCDVDTCCNACAASLRAFDPERPRGSGEGLPHAEAEGAITWAGTECDVLDKAPWAPGRYRLTARSEFIDGHRGLRIVSREAVAPDTRPIPELTVAAVHGDEAALLGRRVRVWGRLEAGIRTCTKKACGRSCCNRCQTPIRLVPDGPVPAEPLTVWSGGQERVCATRDCDPAEKCHPEPAPAWFSGELRRLPEGGVVFDLDGNADPIHP